MPTGYTAIIEEVRWRTKTCCASKLRCRKRDAAPLRASEMKMRPLCELHPDGKDCVYFAYMCHNRRAKRTTWQRLVKETKMRPRSRLHAACCTPTPEGLCARPADHEGDCDSRVAHEDGRTWRLRLVAPEVTWEDRPDEWTEAIQAAHPARSESHDEYGTAMRMVGNRHGKHELVALVNWLLVSKHKVAKEFQDFVHGPHNSLVDTYHRTIREIWQGLRDVLGIEEGTNVVDEVQRQRDHLKMAVELLRESIVPPRAVRWLAAYDAAARAMGTGK